MQKNSEKLIGEMQLVLFMSFFKRGNQRKWFHKNVGISFLNAAKIFYNLG